MNPAQLLNPKAFAKANGNTASHILPSLLTPGDVDSAPDMQNLRFEDDSDSPIVATMTDVAASLNSRDPQQDSLLDLESNINFNNIKKSDMDHLTDDDEVPPRKAAHGQGSKTSIAGSSGPKISVPSFDPAALLNPKAAARRAVTDPEHKDIQSNGASTSDGEDGDTGMSTMIERMHRVGKREYQPQKRQKLDHDDKDDQRRKATFDGAGKGGPLADYVKEKREQGQAELGPSSVVDLTGADDGDDSEVTFVKSTGRDVQDPGREVCMGTLHAKIHADRIPSASNKAFGSLKDLWPRSKIFLSRPPGQSYTFNAVDRLNMAFGKLDPKTAAPLANLWHGNALHKMRLAAALMPFKRREGDAPGKPISELLDVQITVYAAFAAVEGIGKILSQGQLFLCAPPDAQNREIINPHVPKIYVPRGSTLGKVSQYSGVYSTRTVEEVKSDVLGMFDKLTNVEELPEAEGDMNLLATKLMAHQKQALYFLTRQETPIPAGEESSSLLWKSKFRKDGSKVWYNVISGDEVKHVVSPMGGIFADMMGLGKTLSLLARIVADVEDARAFGNVDLMHTASQDDRVERNAKGTLIVCPKSVLSNWDEQIKQHLKRHKISYYGYHGSKRTQDIDELAEYDIVITSYTTVATEFSYSNSRYKALGRLNWYRVVLDEAHMIRNQTTSTFNACCALSATRRWAVTGTPIQNRLADLGALIKFVKLSPFHEKGQFEKNFIAPFKLGDESVLMNLRLMVDSITLRRSKDKIDLPGRVEQIVRLEFSDDESALYEAFAKDSYIKLNAMIGANGLRGRGYAHMLTAITRLRLICAHGRELLSDEDMKMMEGLSYGNAIDLGDEDDNKPRMTEEQVYGFVHLLRESNTSLCSMCSKEIADYEDAEAEEDESDEGESDLLGYMTPCYHLICPGCLPKYQERLEQTMSTDNYANCPECDGYIKAVLAPVTRQGLEADTERRNEIRRNPQKAKNGGNYSGPHTKVKALMHELRKHRHESDLQPATEPPIRSVVFSGWTQYLDLIEVALRDDDIGFVRLDGKMSVPARTRVLEQFRSDATVSVMLVSIKAGGQGLNFTAASKVYMMEPQFNPGVELQAIDRVHRLGQKRAVEITKFIMAGSFEERILGMQQGKLNLANEAFGKDGKQLSKPEIAKKRMEDLRGLFK